MAHLNATSPKEEKVFKKEVIVKKLNILCLITDFSHQVGSLELTVVNVHLSTAASGESVSKNDNSEVKCQRFPHCLLETLKG